MAMSAVSFKENNSVSKTTGLDLNAIQHASVVDDQIVAGTLSEGLRNETTRLRQTQRDNKFGQFADRFRVAQERDSVKGCCEFDLLPCGES